MRDICSSKTHIMECSVFVNTCNMKLIFSHQKYSSDDDKRRKKIVYGQTHVCG